MLAVVILSGAARDDEADGVKVIQKLGGKITRDDKQTGKPVVEVNLIGTKVTDADLKELKELKQLKALHIHSTQVTGVGFSELKELKQLTTLNLYGCAKV